MVRISCLICFLWGFCSNINPQNAKSREMLQDTVTASVLSNFDSLLDGQEGQLNCKLKELELAQKEFFLGKYVTEAGILLSAFGIVFAIFSIGIPIYLYNVERRFRKEQELLQTKLKKLEEEAQKSIGEKVEAVGLFCNNAHNEVKKKLDSLHLEVNSSTIEIKEEERIKIEAQARGIEADDKATNAQKATAKFYAKFYENKFKKCLSQYQIITDKYKDDIAISEVNKLDYYVGICYYKINNYKVSLIYFEKYNKNNNDVRCWYYLANCYLQEREYPQTIAFFKKCLENDELKKDNVVLDNIQSGIGLAYMEMKDYEKALESFEAALHTRENIDDYINIAKVYICKAKHDFSLMDEQHSVQSYKKSVSILKKCIRRFSHEINENDLVPIYTLLGETYLALENIIEALNCFKKIIEIKDDNLTAWLNILFIYKENSSVDIEDKQKYLSKIKLIINR